MGFVTKSHSRCWPHHSFSFLTLAVQCMLHGCMYICQVLSCTNQAFRYQCHQTPLACYDWMCQMPPTGCACYSSSGVTSVTASWPLPLVRFSVSSPLFYYADANAFLSVYCTRFMRWLLCNKWCLIILLWFHNK